MSKKEDASNGNELPINISQCSFIATLGWLDLFVSLFATLQGKRLLLEALASGDSALKMSSAATSARTVFRERELQENAELQVTGNNLAT